VLETMMSRDDEDYDDRDLPWDPMWEYFLGEMDEMDDRDDNARRHGHDRLEERRDSGEVSGAVCGTGILKTLFQFGKGSALKRATPDVATASEREEWKWELDTSPFLLNNGSNNLNKKRNEKNTRNQKTAQDSSWIRTIWRDSSVRQHSPPWPRKPS
jgi:hypothetical protein